MHDLVIAGGLLVDGTGAPPRSASVAVQDGRVVAVGDDLGSARQTISADGCLVTPGFIDPHTHLDCQIWWDPTVSPSCFHGVTTVIMGMCGFGIAPVADGGDEYLLRSLELVEEIPYETTRQGVPFGWNHYSEFLDQLSARPLGVNAAGMVPHSSLRYFVMGERATTDEATPDDLRAMVAEYERSLAAGALGFSTSRGPNHHDADGRPVPSRHATDDEIRALVQASRGLIWQINLASKGSSGTGAVTAEVERYAAWSAEAGALLTWTPFVVSSGDDTAWREILAFNHRLNKDGTRVVPQVMAQPTVVGLTLDGPSLASHVKGWESAMAAYYGLGPDQKRARLSDPDFRATLRAAQADPNEMLAPRYERWRIIVSPTRPEVVGQTLTSVADAWGVHPVDALLDLAISDDLETLIEVPVVNMDTAAVDALVADPTTLIGVGDAGAHIRSITNYSYPTYVLASQVRDRRRLSVEQAIHRMTAQPAALFGIRDRGVLRPGAAADVCVIDLDSLALAPAERVRDLPGGADRLVQRAVGYEWILVNGVTVVEKGEHTGAHPGHLIRRA